MHGECNFNLILNSYNLSMWPITFEHCFSCKETKQLLQSNHCILCSWNSDGSNLYFARFCKESNPKITNKNKQQGDYVCPYNWPIEALPWCNSSIVNEQKTTDVQDQGPSNRNLSLLFASFMFTGLPSPFPLLTVVAFNQ